LKGLSRVLLSRLGIYFSDSIRIVSKFQAQEIVEISKRAESKFVLAPIPIDISRISYAPRDLDFDIAYIGRLHNERGVKEFLKIVKALKFINPDIRIVIVGDGFLWNLIKKDLSKWLTDSTVAMTGFLPPNRMSEIYSSSKILLSCAPREGYGLTLREAVLSGLHVVARVSQGTRELTESFPDAIDVYSDLNQAVGLIQKRLVELRPQQNFEYIQAQVQKDLEGVSRLVDSWLTD
jgi:glycosyltransferase involved in cell wall biosynthesis